MSWTGGTSAGGGTTKKLNAFLMSEDRWQRALKEHNTRVKHVKPAVDLKSPWGCSRPYVPLPPQQQSAAAGGENNNSARRSVTNNNNRYRPGSAATTSRPNSARPMSAATSSRGRPTSAISNSGRGNNNNFTSTTTTSGPQIIAHLPLQQQRVCEEMVKLLAGLSKEQNKAMLEHLYSSAEESRLLQSYSGVYPGLLVSHADEEDGSFRHYDDDNNRAVAAAGTTSRNYHDADNDDDGYIRNEEGDDGTIDQEKFQSHHKPPRK